jgi:hypothetical protein
MYVYDLNEAFDHKISGGDNYLWDCWENARFLEYRSDYAYVSAVFNTETQEVYEVNVSVDTDTWDPDIRPYRWLNPEYKQDYLDEAESRNIDPEQAWDDIKWIDLESADDFLEKALAIFNGDDSFDKRIQVPLDLNEDEILKIALMAHKRDITLNKMVEEIIQLAIDKHKEDNE